MYNLILVPSLFCPANCKYCFGPKHNIESPSGGCENKPMDVGTIEYALDFALRLSVEKGLPLQSDDASGGCVRVIFHGGEPLSAGISFFKETLPRIIEKVSRQHLSKVLPSDKDKKTTPLAIEAAHSAVEFSIQSNLWLLTEDMCKLFAEYRVSLGVSIDGPEEITDAQRGRGYFQKTMDAIDMARRHGISVSCLCTFTRYSAAHSDEVYDFFVQNSLDFSFHQAVPSLNEREEDLWSLCPEEYGELLISLLERYIQQETKTFIGQPQGVAPTRHTQQPPKIKIDTLDSLCQGVAAGKGGICTFTDCLGDFLAIAPDGGIYPCQRFIDSTLGKENNGFCLGNVRNCQDIHSLKAHPFWQYLRQRQDAVNNKVLLPEGCSSCTYLSFCRGGCAYNALASGNKSSKDPYCLAYKRIYGHIIERAMSEVFSEENLTCVVKEGGGLIKKGRLLEIMKGRSQDTE
ncbi:MAG: radical SAM protein [bacterium]